MESICATLVREVFQHPLFWIVIRRFIYLNVISDEMPVLWVSKQVDIWQNTKGVLDISTKWISTPFLDNPLTIGLSIVQIVKLVFVFMDIWPSIYSQRATSWSWKIVENFLLACMIEWNRWELISMQLTPLLVRVHLKVWKNWPLPYEINNIQFIIPKVC